MRALTGWEVQDLAVRSQNNNLAINVSKTKELIVNFWRYITGHFPIAVDKAAVDVVNSFTFLGVQISDDMTWSHNTGSIITKAQQCLYFLRWLRKFGRHSSTLVNFYLCTIESVLTGCITAWYVHSTAQDRMAIQKIVRTAQKKSYLQIFHPSRIFTPTAATERPSAS